MTRTTRERLVHVPAAATALIPRGVAAALPDDPASPAPLLWREGLPVHARRDLIAR